MSDKIEVGLRRGRKTDFNFLETDVEQHFEHAQFALAAHRFNQCLIAITQIDTAPVRGGFDGLIGPLAVGQRNLCEWLVFIAGACCFLVCHVCACSELLAQSPEG